MIKKLLFIALFTLSTSANAYYYTYSYGKGVLYPDISFGVSKGTKESINLYTQYGVTNNLDLNVWIPDAYHYDGPAKQGSAFYSNPTVGYFYSFINDDNNKLGTFANFMLPFRDPRGFDMDMAIIYSRKVADAWNVITGLDVPFDKYSGVPADVTLTYIIGTEYTKGNFFSQLAFNISEQVNPARAFGIGAEWYRNTQQVR